jgi:hypothetical protein
MNFIKNNFQFLIIIILGIVIILMTCNTPKPQPVEVSRDTVLIIERPISGTTGQPIIVSTEPAPVVIPPQYQPAPDYSGLIAQYQALLNEYRQTNKYQETIKLTDSAGNDRGKIDLSLGVQENKLKPIDYTYQLKYPQITVTQTVPYRQFYVGGQLNTSLTSLNINGIQGGVLYKDKKDNIFGANAGAMKIGDKVTYGGLTFYRPLGKKK